MDFSWNVYSTQKYGCAIDEYEDYFTATLERSLNSINLRCAMADGASESSFASVWAKQLCRAYVKSEFNDKESLRDVIESLIVKWTNAIKWKKLPWYAEEKAKKGAFSTLLGIHFNECPASNRTARICSVISIGDSCAFQIRKNKLIRCIPIEDSSEFNRSPILLSSILESNNNVWNNLFVASFEWEKEDVFLLMTDALACYFLSYVEKGLEPWIDILNLCNASSDSFNSWVSMHRLGGQLKNDDVTLAIIRL